MVDLALVPGHDRGDVLFDRLGQGGLVADVVHPARQLAVPDKSMSADGLVALGGPVDKVVGLCPVVFTLLGVDALPLHAILRRHLAKVGFDDGRVFARGESPLVGASAKVLLTLGLEQLVDALGGLARLEGVDCGCRRDRERRQQKHDTGLHLDGA